MTDASIVPMALTAELDQSVEDVRAGRLLPLGPVLSAMHTRAVGQLADRKRHRSVRADGESIEAN